MKWPRLLASTLTGLAACSASNDDAVVASQPSCWGMVDCSGVTVATTAEEVQAALLFWGYSADATEAPRAGEVVLIAGVSEGSDCKYVVDKVDVREEEEGSVIDLHIEGNGTCQVTDWNARSFVVRVKASSPVTAVELNGEVAPFRSPGAD